MTARRLWADHRPEILVVLTFFLLGLGWLVSNPPGGAADEPSHYVRMVGLAEGDLIGADLRPGEGPQPGERSFDRASINFDRIRKEAGRYSIPGRAPPPDACNRVRPAQPFACPPVPTSDVRIDAVSLHARTLPGSYVLPALLTRFAGSTNGKLYLGRLGYLLQNAALFAVAVAFGAGVLRGSRREVYLALLLACSPLLMFQMGSLSPDGTEAVALLAFAAALLALVQRPSRARWWWVVGLAVATIWVRDLGLVYVPAVAGIVAVAARHRLGGVVRTLRRAEWGGLGLVVAAGTAAFVWRAELLYNDGGLDLTAHRLRQAFDNFHRLVPDSFGRVGWHDVASDRVITRLWVAAFAALLITLAARSRGWAISAGAVGLLYVLTNVALWLTLTAVGYFDQERFTVVLGAVAVLVASALFPLPGPSGRVAEALQVPIVAIAAAGHLSVFVVNAQRHAHGLNAEPLSFRTAAWRPPIGWAASFGLVGAACLLVLALPSLVVLSTHTHRPGPGLTE